MRNIIRILLEKIGVLRIQKILRSKNSKYFLTKNFKKIKSNGKIKVAFIVYEPGMWDKQEPVCLEMLEREDIEPHLIVVDDVSISQEKRDKKREFFIQKYTNVLLYNKEVIKKFKNREFQYTFYQTPYNYKYPAAIRPYNVVKYSKICYIPYGYTGASDFFSVSSNVTFYENVYFGFMDSEPMLELLCEKFSKDISKGIKKIEFLGYPPFENYFNFPDRSGKIEKALWLPRWSYAQKGGGSHFLEYKDLYNTLAKQNGDLKFALRPHPLMFNSFLNLGIMTEEDISNYKNSLLENDILLDEYRLVNDSLQDTDIMIADYSSVIIMYFLSGRPIIYCDCNIELSGLYAEIRDTLYIANSWEEVLKYFNDLKNGIDPLKEKRMKIIEKEALKHKDSAKRIVDAIINDYTG